MVSTYLFNFPLHSYHLSFVLSLLFIKLVYALFLQYLHNTIFCHHNILLLTAGSRLSLILLQSV